MMAPDALTCPHPNGGGHGGPGTGALFHRNGVPLLTLNRPIHISASTRWTPNMDVYAEGALAKARTAAHAAGGHLYLEIEKAMPRSFQDQAFDALHGQPG